MCCTKKDFKESFSKLFENSTSPAENFLGQTMVLPMRGFFLKKRSKFTLRKVESGSEGTTKTLAITRLQAP
jgi:hypothetical protein